jgi:hypothetical protein
MKAHEKAADPDRCPGTRACFLPAMKPSSLCALRAGCRESPWSMRWLWIDWVQRRKVATAAFLSAERGKWVKDISGEWAWNRLRETLMVALAEPV